MTEPIDHAVRAREIARDALVFVQKTMDPNKSSVSHADAKLMFDTAQTQMAAAQIEATLAVAASQDRATAAQDRANELKRIEILVELSYGGGYNNPDASSTSAEVAAWDELHDPDVKGHPLAPSIAASLGLGGESDGE